MLGLLILLVVLGLVAWAVYRFLPMLPGKFKSLIYFVLIVFGIVAVLSEFGVFAYLDRPVPKLHR